MQIWAKRLAELDRKQDYLLDLATDTAMPIDKLRAKLDALETDRKTATCELEGVRSKVERLTALRLEAETLIEAYSRKARAGLDLYTPQDRYDAYKSLGVKIIIYPDGKKELTCVPLCSDLETQST